MAKGKLPPALAAYMAKKKSKSGGGAKKAKKPMPAFLQKKIKGSS